MSTYIIDSEPEASTLADDDELLCHDASAGRTRKVGADTMRSYMHSGVVSITDSTVSITQAAHGGQTITLDRAAGITATLPAASGTGAVYRFVVGTTVTSNDDIIQVANATDEFVGNLFQIDTDTSDAIAAYPALDGDGFDTITMNGTTTGGLQGDLIEIVDVAAGKFSLSGTILSTGSVASPLSADVS